MWSLINPLYLNSYASGTAVHDHFNFQRWKSGRGITGGLSVDVVISFRLYFTRQTWSQYGSQVLQDLRHIIDQRDRILCEFCISMRHFLKSFDKQAF